MSHKCLYQYFVVRRGGTGGRNYSNGKTYYGNENRGYDQERPDATPMVTFTPNPAQTQGIAVNDSSVTKVRLSFFQFECEASCVTKFIKIQTVGNATITV